MPWRFRSSTLVLTTPLQSSKTCPYTPSLPQHPIPRFRIHIKRFALVPRGVENLVKRHREVRRGRFITAFEHPVRQVLEGEPALLLA